MKKLAAALPALLLAASFVRAESPESLSVNAENFNPPSLQTIKARAATVLAKKVSIQPGDSVFIRGKDSVAAIAYEALLEELMANAKQIYQDYGRDGILCLDNGSCIGSNSLEGMNPTNAGLSAKRLQIIGATSKDGSLKITRVTLTNGHVACINAFLGHEACGLLATYQFDVFANGEIDVDAAPAGLTIADLAVRKVLMQDIGYFMRAHPAR